MEITLLITNEEDQQYLSNLYENKDIREVNKILNTALSIGIKSINMTTIEMNGSSYYKPIQNIIDNHMDKNEDNLEYIKSILDELMNIKQNSSRKGKLGESLAINSLLKKYPDWEVIDCSDINHEGDCCVNSDKYGKILYELKTYTTNVGKDEISKFKKDVDTTNSLYGVFISQTSGIVGKKMIDVEIYNQKILIYVSNSGLNGHGIELGTELLIQLINSNILDNKYLLTTNNYQSYLEDLNDMMNELMNSINNFSRISSQINESKQQVSNIFDNLYKKAFDYHNNGITIINKLCKTIHDNKLDSINIVTKCKSDDYELILEKVNDKNNKMYLEQLWSLCNKYTIDISINPTIDNTIYFIKDKTIIAKLLIKTKLELLFIITDLSTITINGNYEKIKNDTISLHISKNSVVWDIIEKRLQQII
jgi:hypothetical protein